MAPDHRRAPVAPRPGAREIDGVSFTLCRGCGEPVRTATGAPDRRRLWHPECAHAYLLARRPAYVRGAVWQRDHGVCARCGRDCSRSGEWDADHVLPLIDGGGAGLANLQTLCLPCHHAKTAGENARRRPCRRWRAAEEAGQLRLELAGLEAEARQWGAPGPLAEETGR